MTVTPKIYDFPTFPIAQQLFYVPGAAIDGGFTVGGAATISPEPGGFGMLDLQPALITGEWQYPLASWIMSKTNGQILRVRLAPTPQVASARFNSAPWSAGVAYPEMPWSNEQNWSGDGTAVFADVALEGTTTMIVETGAMGAVFQAGHVIGHKFSTYLIDEIIYNGTVAIMTVTPPVRRDISVGDVAVLRPWFTGRIKAGEEFRAPYDARMAGIIEMGMIKLVEAIV